MATSANFSFSQLPNNSSIPNTWVLLDSQSTMSVFNNPRYLTNIRRSTSMMTVITNGGFQSSTQIGEIANFGTVWYNPDSIANILSLAEVRKVCRVTMDTAVEPAICVHRANGKIMKFIEFSSGLYFHDPKAATVPKTNYTFVATVAENKKLFTTREVADADEALALHRKLGRPSQQHFEMMLRDGLIRNCPITIDDAKRALTIYGPCVASLKGTATKSSAEHVPSLVPQMLPASVLEHHQSLTLCIDVFYVQKIPFLTTISRKLRDRKSVV